MPFCIPKTKEEQEQYRKLVDLMDLFDGKPILDIDGKNRKVDDAIEISYGRSDTAMGELMFSEIVWRSTYKTPDAYMSLKPADFRRIANEISKESDKLKNPSLNFLEKYGFVKRGVMRKHAITNWFNKAITGITNYERTKYSTFILRNREVSQILRQESVRRGGQSKVYMGIKAEKRLDQLESKLFEVLHDVSYAKEKGENAHILSKKANFIRDEIWEHLKTEGGAVLFDFAQYMNTAPKHGRITKLDGTEYSENIIKAGNIARDMMNELGGVFINGLSAHKNVITQSFLFKHKYENKDRIDSVGRRVGKYINRVDAQIKAIEEGIKKSNYFPHYLMEAMVRIENVQKKIDERNEKATTEKWTESEAESYLSNLESVFSKIREEIGKSPVETQHRKQLAYDNWIKNPLAVIRKYGYDAIAFNKAQHLKNTYMRTIKHMPRSQAEGDAAHAMGKYLTDVYTLADKGFTDRPNWVNKTVRLITGIEFLSKIGFGVGTAARNTMSGMYYIQGLGNRKFLQYMREWVAPTNKKWQKEIRDIEQEQGFLFRDLAEELYTEGLVPTKGVRVSEIDIVIDEASGKPAFKYKQGSTWKALDSGLAYAAGKGAVFQRVTENMLRKHMFRSSYLTKRKELDDFGVKGKKASDASRIYALDMVNKYAFEYAAHQKAPFVGGAKGSLGAVGQVMFQFFHYPTSFLQLQSELLRNSKDAIMAKQWDNPDTLIPMRFAALAGVTYLMSGIFNRDLTRIMENDTIDRVKNIYDVLNGQEDVKGRGYIGPAVGDLFFYATLLDIIKMPDHEFVNLIVGYNDAYKLTDEQKQARLLSTFNVELSKLVTKQMPMIMSGKGQSIMMHELGIYPRKWTKDLHKKIFGKYSKVRSSSKKKKDTEYEVPLYAKPIMSSLDNLPKSSPLNKYSPQQISSILKSLGG